jgi:hypothetical protein
MRAIFNQFMHEKVKRYFIQIKIQVLLKAFPCFDEPSFQATFALTLEHPQNSTIALSNLASTVGLIHSVYK